MSYSKRFPADMSLQDRIIEASEPVPESGCWIWLRGLQSVGYGYVRMNSQNRGAHQLSYEAFVGPIPKGRNVLHTCDVRECVNPNHLFIGTKSDNTRDMVNKFRMGPQKLRVDQVIAIRNDNRPQSVVADEYGIDPTHVWRIRTKKSWAWITGESK